MDTPETPRPALAPFRAASFVRQYLPILISGGLGVALSATLFFAVVRWDRIRVKSLFDQQAEIRATAVHQRIATSLKVLDGIKVFYAVSPEVDRPAFHILANEILAEHPEIRVIEWAPRAAGERFPISYVEPADGHESAIGFDVSSDPTRRAAVERARETGKPVMTGRLRPVQGPADLVAVAAYVPINREAALARRDRLQGFVIAVYGVRDLVELSLIGLKPALMDIWLVDESAGPEHGLLYYRQSSPPAQGGPPDLKPFTRTSFTWSTTFDVGGRLWSFHASPTHGFLVLHRNWLPWSVLSVGLLLTLLLINILFNALRRSAQVERQVARRTEELTAQVAERRRAESALTISELRYRRLFETAKDGILILDGGTGLITDVNPFLIDMLGYTPEEIVGKRLWEIGPFKDIARSKVAFDQLQTQEYVRYEDLPLQTKHGQPMDVEFVSNVYQVDSKRVIQCNIRDITARKRAEKALQAAHTELERKVQERTGELSSANVHLEASYEQVRRLALRLQSIREDERSGIARELHDELGQALTALKMDLVWASGKLPAEQGAVPERITSMVALVDRMVETVQQVSSTLRPGILDDFGLLEAMRWQVREFEKRTGIACRIDIELEQVELDPDHVTSLFRILQEALTNVARHSEATETAVRFTASGHQLVLEIADNGKGITMGQINNAASLGLTGMRERALLLKGRVIVTGAPGRGTTVRVEMPYTAPAPETARI